jgi:hypothetical protein
VESSTTPSPELDTTDRGPSGPLAGPISLTDRASRGVTDALIDPSAGIHLRSRCHQ